MFQGGAVNAKQNRLSEVTRRNIIDTITLSGIAYHGRLDETDFLGRLFNLAELPSYDGRFQDAGGDIFQHRINNHDWEDDWVWSDSRFNLLHGPEDEFLGFLAEMVHPAVRSDSEETTRICEMLNPLLRQEGWELAEGKRIAGRPVFMPQRAGMRLSATVPKAGRLVPCFSAMIGTSASNSAL